MPPPRLQRTITRLTRLVTVVQAPAPRMEPEAGRPMTVVRPPQRMQVTSPATRDSTTVRLRSRRRAPATTTAVEGPARRTRSVVVETSAVLSEAAVAAQATETPAQPAGNRRSRWTSLLPQPTAFYIRCTSSHQLEQVMAASNNTARGDEPSDN